MKKYLSRRQLLNYLKLSFLFLVNACSNISKKQIISFQKSFFPDSFKDTFPVNWQQENINYSELKFEKNKGNLLKSDFVFINDGWIESIEFDHYQNINSSFLIDQLDKRSKNFLSNFDENERNKIYPIGIVPYVVIIKNSKELLKYDTFSWDFLLSDNLSKKIIFPKSPRILISIAQKIKAKNSLKQLKDQAMLFDDQNSLNWLINSDAIVAILPYSLCSKYLKIDTRLSIVFPDQGVPLMWNFILRKSNSNNESLISWLDDLKSKKTIDRLANQGWYLPFNNKNVQNKYISQSNSIYFKGPSKQCWENSWSFAPLNERQKINLENLWNKYLIP